MADKITPSEPRPAVTDATPPAAGGTVGAAATPGAAPVPPRRGPGHRGADVRDTVAEMAARAQEISQEAGSKIAAAMKDVIGAAAGLTGFAVESARDLVQYMVRRGQMTPEEADKLMREAEEAHAKRGGSRPAPPPPAPRGEPAEPRRPVTPMASMPVAPAPAMTPRVAPAVKSPAPSIVRPAERAPEKPSPRPAAKPAVKSAKPARSAKAGPARSAAKAGAKTSRPASKSAKKPAGKPGKSPAKKKR